MATAPDGTLYIADMYRGIIEGAEWAKEGTYLREKIKQYQLDKAMKRGRVWRLSYDGIERDRTMPRMLSETPAQLVATCRTRTAGGATRRSSCSSSSRIGRSCLRSSRSSARRKISSRASTRCGRSKA